MTSLYHAAFGSDPPAEHVECASDGCGRYLSDAGPLCHACRVIARLVEEAARTPPAAFGTRPLLEAWTAGRSPATRRAYHGDIRHLAAHLGLETADDVAETLVRGGVGQANLTLLGWVQAMVEAGLASSTISRRLSAVRSLIKTMRLSGVIAWGVDIDGPTVRPMRDTRGIGWDAFQAAMANTAIPPRDRAALLLMGERGLRRGEVCALRDPDDIDGATQGLWVLGKGRRERELVTLAPTTLAALDRWRMVRPGGAGYVFPGKDGGRLAGQTVYVMAQKWCACRPHALRHTAITRAAEVTNGHHYGVQEFARHAHGSAATGAYIDNLADLAGEVARKVAAGEVDDGRDHPRD